MGFGLTELVIVGTIVFLIILPLTLIFRPIVTKAGFSGWWVVLLMVPFLNIALIWLFAFIEWPAESKAPD